MDTKEISLRDHFAGQIMAQLVGNNSNCTMAIRRDGIQAWFQKQADYSYEAADALLQSRDKGDKK